MSCTCSLVSKTDHGAGNATYVFACQRDGTFRNITLMCGNDVEAQSLAETECNRLAEEEAKGLTGTAADPALLANAALRTAMQDFFAAVANVKGEETERIFFPNGIHSIRFKAEITLTAQIKAALEFELNGPAPASSASSLFHAMDATAALPLDEDDAVRQACASAFEANKTECNLFAIAVAKILGITLAGNADSLAEQTRNAPWTNLGTDATQAKQKADAGYLVIGSLKSTELGAGEQHGHVVVVESGGLVNGKYPMASWGKHGGIGKLHSSVNYAFREPYKDQVIYSYLKV